MHSKSQRAHSRSSSSECSSYCICLDGETSSPRPESELCMDANRTQSHTSWQSVLRSRGNNRNSQEEDGEAVFGTNSGMRFHYMSEEDAPLTLTPCSDGFRSACSPALTTPRRSAVSTSMYPNLLTSFRLAALTASESRQPTSEMPAVLTRVEESASQNALLYPVVRSAPALPLVRTTAAGNASLAECVTPRHGTHTVRAAGRAVMESHEPTCQVILENDASRGRDTLLTGLENSSDNNHLISNVTNSSSSSITDHLRAKINDVHCSNDYAADSVAAGVLQADPSSRVDHLVRDRHNIATTTSFPSTMLPNTAHSPPLPLHRRSTNRANIAQKAHPILESAPRAATTKTLSSTPCSSSFALTVDRNSSSGSRSHIISVPWVAFLKKATDRIADGVGGYMRQVLDSLAIGEAPKNATTTHTAATAANRRKQIELRRRVSGAQVNSRDARAQKENNDGDSLLRRHDRTDASESDKCDHAARGEGGASISGEMPVSIYTGLHDVFDEFYPITSVDEIDDRQGNKNRNSKAHMSDDRNHGNDHANVWVRPSSMGVRPNSDIPLGVQRIRIDPAKTARKAKRSSAFGVVAQSGNATFAWQHSSLSQDALRPPHTLENDFSNYLNGSAQLAVAAAGAYNVDDNGSSMGAAAAAAAAAGSGRKNSADSDAEGDCHTVEVNLESGLRSYCEYPNEWHSHLIAAALNTRSVDHPVTAEELAEANHNPFLVRMIVDSGCLCQQDPAVQDHIRGTVNELILMYPDGADPALHEYLSSFFRLCFVHINEDQCMHLKQCGFEYITLMYFNPHVLPASQVNWPLAPNSDKLMILGLVFLAIDIGTMIFFIVICALVIAKWMSPHMTFYQSFGFCTLLVLGCGYALNLIAMIFIVHSRQNEQMYEPTYGLMIPSPYLCIVPFVPIYSIVSFVTYIRAQRAGYVILAHNTLAASCMSSACFAVSFGFPQLITLSLLLSLIDQNSAYRHGWNYLFNLLTVATFVQWGWSFFRFAFQTLLYYSVDGFGFARFNIRDSKCAGRFELRILYLLNFAMLFLLESDIYLIINATMRLSRMYGNDRYLPITTLAFSGIGALCCVLIITWLIFDVRISRGVLYMVPILFVVHLVLFILATRRAMWRSSDFQRRVFMRYFTFGYGSYIVYFLISLIIFGLAFLAFLQTRAGAYIISKLMTCALAILAKYNSCRDRCRKKKDDGDGACPPSDCDTDHNNSDTTTNNNNDNDDKAKSKCDDNKTKDDGNAGCDTNKAEEQESKSDARCADSGRGTNASSPSRRNSSRATAPAADDVT